MPDKQLTDHLAQKPSDSLAQQRSDSLAQQPNNVLPGLTTK